ncbi:NfeD family protein [Falsiroseomonas sp.]|uniref:NfeD family protein n=1 Tax=Falsiroseomonas sp. TaxID=2870721 RepID=UPI0034A51998
MDAGLIWLLVGVALLGAELAVPGVYLVWVGLAAAGTGLLLLGADPGFAGAVLTFLLLLAAGLFASVQLKRRGGPAHRINAPEAGLAGRRAVVVATGAPGLRVRLGDSEWPARLTRGAAAPETGDTVRVEAVDGTVLVVRPEAKP